ncbi:MAG: GDSL-type esterase/lipase family protein, partial [Rothia sp. (in: high G+C Gram-positive bacteria)]|uniref:GDSL-type esterase/lipase family protein n=1 Tax=Rothia sp. (in: high G+C Gram-positive bacteria) TaxID=1885016 RepID=UPI0026DF4FE9
LYGAVYIDLWDDFVKIGEGDGAYTNDKVHLTAQAYRIWCKKIAAEVNATCTYDDKAVNNFCGQSGVHALRASYFAMSPVNDGDILMVGDGTICGMEWHELMHSDKVKSRGTGWGVPGANISTNAGMLEGMLQGKGKPAQIYFYTGTADVTATGADLEAIATSYKAMVEKAHTLCPEAKIYVMSLLPYSNKATCDASIVPFNEKLQTLANELDYATYVDCFTPLAKEGAPKADYFTGVYLYGLGYAKLSETLAPLMKEADSKVTATTEAEAKTLRESLVARNALAAALTTAEKLSIGTGVGQFTAENAKAVTELIEAGYKLLAGTPTNEELNTQTTTLTAAIAALGEKLNMPTASTTSKEVWYQMSSLRSADRVVTSNGVGQGVTTSENQQYAESMWKFVSRTDGSYDIVNRGD